MVDHKRSKQNSRQLIVRYQGVHNRCESAANVRASSIRPSLPPARAYRVANSFLRHHTKTETLPREQSREGRLFVVATRFVIAQKEKTCASTVVVHVTRRGRTTPSLDPEIRCPAFAWFTYPTLMSSRKNTTIPQNLYAV